MSKQSVGNHGTIKHYDFIEQIPSYAALHAVVPTAVGQHIFLESYNDGSSATGWKTLGTIPLGGGEFVSFSGYANDDGGTIVTVNNEWHWKRVMNGWYTPEMFGSDGSGADDVPMITRAVWAAYAAGTDLVHGDGIYTFKTSYVIPALAHGSPVEGAHPRQGLELYLNIVIVDAASWDPVPLQWWDATAAFYPALGVEHLRLQVNSFDGGQKASFLHTKGGSIATSQLHIGNMRNHIIGIRNYLDMAHQSTMVNITGHLWQDGYIAILNGGMGKGVGNAECWGIDINWVAAHKYTGISMQDRSQYSHIKAGTVDYNGDYTSMITLTDIDMQSDYAVEFGSELTDGETTGIALSNVMTDYGRTILLITECENKRNGISDYKIGNTLSNADGSFHATIASVETTSDIDVRYFDIILSNITAGFSRCYVTCTYGGGVYGSNMFTNIIWLPNAVAGTNTSSLMGLQIGGSATNQFWYLREVFGNTPFFSMSASGLTVEQPMIVNQALTLNQPLSLQHPLTLNHPLVLNNNEVIGKKSTVHIENGGQAEVMTFDASNSDFTPHLFEIFSVSSIAGQSGTGLVRVGTNGINLINEKGDNLGYLTSGFSLYVVLTGSNGTITTTATKRI